MTYELLVTSVVRRRAKFRKLRFFIAETVLLVLVIESEPPVLCPLVGIRVLAKKIKILKKLIKNY